jgi:hypothetical protein
MYNIFLTLETRENFAAARLFGGVAVKYMCAAEEHTGLTQLTKLQRLYLQIALS